MNASAMKNLFTYHAPTGTQPSQYAAIRSAAQTFAEIVCDNTPPSRMRDDAVMLIHSAMMKANAAIATDGQF